MTNWIDGGIYLLGDKPYGRPLQIARHTSKGWRLYNMSNVIVEDILEGVESQLHNTERMEEVAAEDLLLVGQFKTG